MLGEYQECSFEEGAPSCDASQGLECVAEPTFESADFCAVQQQPQLQQVLLQQTALNLQAIVKTVATLSLETSVTTTSVDSVMIQLVMPIRTGLIVLLKMGWQVIVGVSTTTTVVLVKVVVYLHAWPI